MDQAVLTSFPSAKGKEQAHEITKMAVLFITVCLPFTTSEPVFPKSGTNVTPPQDTVVSSSSVPLQLAITT